MYYKIQINNKTIFLSYDEIKKFPIIETNFKYNTVFKIDSNLWDVSEELIIRCLKSKIINFHERLRLYSFYDFLCALDYIYVYVKSEYLFLYSKYNLTPIIKKHEIYNEIIELYNTVYTYIPKEIIEEDLELDLIMDSILYLANKSIKYVKLL